MSSPRDNDWFLEQVQREQSRLRAFIRALGVRAEAVDDLAQDALVVAFEKLGTFDPTGPGDFGSWVRGIARRLAANALRKEGRRQRILSDHVSELLVGAKATQLHPLAETADTDRLESLRHCLEKLPDHSRQFIQLRYFEQLTPGAIGSRLDRSANDVRQVLFRIRRLLLECVEKQLARITQ